MYKLRYLQNYIVYIDILTVYSAWSDAYAYAWVEGLSIQDKITITKYVLCNNLIRFLYKSSKICRLSEPVIMTLTAVVI